ncbi:MAG: hypothetical protein KC649_00040, partial [Candidatus Omnitrophica bacterium]|nr:hypothetical protein [Candidatus Omnitrophota bacterium]
MSLNGATTTAQHDAGLALVGNVGVSAVMGNKSNAVQAVSFDRPLTQLQASQFNSSAVATLTQVDGVSRHNLMRVSIGQAGPAEVRTMVSSYSAVHPNGETAAFGSTSLTYSNESGKVYAQSTGSFAYKPGMQISGTAFKPAASGAIPVVYTSMTHTVGEPGGATLSRRISDFDVDTGLKDRNGAAILEHHTFATQSIGGQQDPNGEGRIISSTVQRDVPDGNGGTQKASIGASVIIGEDNQARTVSLSGSYKDKSGVTRMVRQNFAAGETEMSVGAVLDRIPLSAETSGMRYSNVVRWSDKGAMANQLTATMSGTYTTSAGRQILGTFNLTDQTLKTKVGSAVSDMSSRLVVQITPGKSTPVEQIINGSLENGSNRYSTNGEIAITFDGKGQPALNTPAQQEAYAAMQTAETIHLAGRFGNNYTSTAERSAELFFEARANQSAIPAAQIEGVVMVSADESKVTFATVNAFNSVAQAKIQLGQALDNPAFISEAELSSFAVPGNLTSEQQTAVQTKINAAQAAVAARAKGADAAIIDNALADGNYERAAEYSSIYEATLTPSLTGGAIATQKDLATVRDSYTPGADKAAAQLVVSKVEAHKNAVRLIELGANKQAVVAALSKGTDEAFEELKQAVVLWSNPQKTSTQYAAQSDNAPYAATREFSQNETRVTSTSSQAGSTSQNQETVNTLLTEASKEYGAELTLPEDIASQSEAVQVAYATGLAKLVADGSESPMSKKPEDIVQIGVEKMMTAMKIDAPTEQQIQNFVSLIADNQYNETQLTEFYSGMKDANGAHPYMDNTTADKQVDQRMAMAKVEIGQAIMQRGINSGSATMVKLGQDVILKPCDGCFDSAIANSEPQQLPQVIEILSGVCTVCSQTNIGNTVDNNRFAGTIAASMKQGIQQMDSTSQLTTGTMRNLISVTSSNNEFGNAFTAGLTAGTEVTAETLQQLNVSTQSGMNLIAGIQNRSDDIQLTTERPAQAIVEKAIIVDLPFANAPEMTLDEMHSKSEVTRLNVQASIAGNNGVSKARIDEILSDGSLSFTNKMEALQESTDAEGEQRSKNLIADLRVRQAEDLGISGYQIETIMQNENLSHDQKMVAITAEIDGQKALNSAELRLSIARSTAEKSGLGTARIESVMAEGRAKALAENPQATEADIMLAQSADLSQFATQWRAINASEERAKLAGAKSDQIAQAKQEAADNLGEDATATEIKEAQTKAVNALASTLRAEQTASNFLAASEERAKSVGATEEQMAEAKLKGAETAARNQGHTNQDIEKVKEAAVTKLEESVAGQNKDDKPTALQIQQAEIAAVEQLAGDVAAVAQAQSLELNELAVSQTELESRVDSLYTDLTANEKRPITQEEAQRIKDTAEIDSLTEQAKQQGFDIERIKQVLIDILPENVTEAEKNQAQIKAIRAIVGIQISEKKVLIAQADALQDKKTVLIADIGLETAIASAVERTGKTRDQVEADLFSVGSGFGIEATKAKIRAANKMEAEQEKVDQKAVIAQAKQEMKDLRNEAETTVFELTGKKLNFSKASAAEIEAVVGEVKAQRAQLDQVAEKLGIDSDGMTNQRLYLAVQKRAETAIREITGQSVDLSQATTAQISSALSGAQETKKQLVSYAKTLEIENPDTMNTAQLARAVQIAASVEIKEVTGGRLRGGSNVAETLVMLDTVRTEGQQLRELAVQFDDAGYEIDDIDQMNIPQLQSVIQRQAVQAAADYRVVQGEVLPVVNMSAADILESVTDAKVTRTQLRAVAVELGTPNANQMNSKQLENNIVRAAAAKFKDISGENMATGLSAQDAVQQLGVAQSKKDAAVVLATVLNNAGYTIENIGSRTTKQLETAIEKQSNKFLNDMKVKAPEPGQIEQFKQLISQGVFTDQQLTQFYKGMKVGDKHPYMDNTTSDPSTNQRMAQAKLEIGQAIMQRGLETDNQTLVILGEDVILKPCDGCPDAALKDATEDQKPKVIEVLAGICTLCTQTSAGGTEMISRNFASAMGSQLREAVRTLPEGVSSELDQAWVDQFTTPESTAASKSFIDAFTDQTGRVPVPMSQETTQEDVVDDLASRAPPVVDDETLAKYAEDIPGFSDDVRGPASVAAGQGEVVNSGNEPKTAQEFIDGVAAKLDTPLTQPQKDMLTALFNATVGVENAAYKLNALLQHPNFDCDNFSQAYSLLAKESGLKVRQIAIHGVAELNDGRFVDYGHAMNVIELRNDDDTRLFLLVEPQNNQVIGLVKDVASGEQAEQDAYQTLAEIWKQSANGANGEIGKTVTVNGVESTVTQVLLPNDPVIAGEKITADNGRQYDLPDSAFEIFDAPVNIDETATRKAIASLETEIAGNKSTLAQNRQQLESVTADIESGRVAKDQLLTVGSGANERKLTAEQFQTELQTKINRGETIIRDQEIRVQEMRSTIEVSALSHIFEGTYDAAIGEFIESVNNRREELNRNRPADDQLPMISKEGLSDLVSTYVQPAEALSTETRTGLARITADKVTQAKMNEIVAILQPNETKIVQILDNDGSIVATATLTHQGIMQASLTRDFVTTEEAEAVAAQLANQLGINLYAVTANGSIAGIQGTFIFKEENNRAVIAGAQISDSSPITTGGAIAKITLAEKTLGIGRESIQLSAKVDGVKGTFGLDRDNQLQTLATDKPKMATFKEQKSDGTTVFEIQVGGAKQDIEMILQNGVYVPKDGKPIVVNGFEVTLNTGDKVTGQAQIFKISTDGNMLFSLTTNDSYSIRDESGNNNLASSPAADNQNGLTAPLGSANNAMLTQRTNADGSKVIEVSSINPAGSSVMHFIDGEPQLMQPGSTLVLNGGAKGYEIEGRLLAAGTLTTVKITSDGKLQFQENTAAVDVRTGFTGTYEKASGDNASQFNFDAGQQPRVVQHEIGGVTIDAQMYTDQSGRVRFVADQTFRIGDTTLRVEADGAELRAVNNQPIFVDENRAVSFEVAPGFTKTVVVRAELVGLTASGEKIELYKATAGTEITKKIPEGSGSGDSKDKPILREGLESENLDVTSRRGYVDITFREGAQLLVIGGQVIPDSVGANGIRVFNDTGKLIATVNSTIERNAKTINGERLTSARQNVTYLKNGDGTFVGSVDDRITLAGNTSFGKDILFDQNGVGQFNVSRDQNDRLGSGAVLTHIAPTKADQQAIIDLIKNPELKALAQAQFDEAYRKADEASGKLKLTLSIAADHNGNNQIIASGFSISETKASREASLRAGVLREMAETDELKSARAKDRALESGANFAQAKAEIALKQLTGKTIEYLTLESQINIARENLVTSESVRLDVNSELRSLTARSNAVQSLTRQGLDPAKITLATLQFEAGKSQELITSEMATAEKRLRAAENISLNERLVIEMDQKQVRAKLSQETLNNEAELVLREEIEANKLPINERYQIAQSTAEVEDLISQETTNKIVAANHSEAQAQAKIDQQSRADVMADQTALRAATKLETREAQSKLAHEDALLEAEKPAAEKAKIIAAQAETDALRKQETAD